MVQITRIYSTDDGESHFDELTEECVESRNYADYSRAIDVYGLSFRETGSQANGEPDLGAWHVAPRRQYVLFMRGKTEIEVSDGEKRILTSGDVLLVEDTFGRGHRNRRLSRAPQLWAFVRSNAEKGIDEVIRRV
ncbi:MAG: hypothetical protein CFH10_00623 [Alphaproteobacteria bacterium MarineAlpha4_Bin2]|nr:MAG: hypothetical protein CFH10_00623 [Alphaproteobacteria bacterium MarineAlpha4_Bin2]|tara:strand:+ start:92 stop:496 length:405 start_codon:yes stop_codon:yes gene_type:complete